MNKASYDTYEVHGSGVETLRTGLTAIGMPEHRRRAAIDAVRAIVAAEGISGFCWYKVPNTKEVAAYWTGCGKNMLWIEPGNVHVHPDVAFPLTVTGLKSGYQPMHHLPGANPRPDARRSSQNVATPLPCQRCMNVHPPEEECYSASSVRRVSRTPPKLPTCQSPVFDTRAATVSFGADVLARSGRPLNGLGD